MQDWFATKGALDYRLNLATQIAPFKRARLIMIRELARMETAHIERYGCFGTAGYHIALEGIVEGKCDTINDVIKHWCQRDTDDRWEALAAFCKTIIAWFEYEEQVRQAIDTQPPEKNNIRVQDFEAWRCKRQS